MYSLKNNQGFFLTILAFLCLGLPGNLWARTLRVPDEYPNIPAAIDAAEAGDEIHLSPGEYKGNFELKAKVSLIGGDTTTTVLMPGDGIAGPVVTVADQCSIENLTITKALAGSQAAVLLKGGDSLVWHNLIKDNLAAAIAVEGTLSAHPNIENNHILHNKGAGIVVVSASPTIKNNIINSNLNAGILATNASPIIEGNKILYNGDAGISVVAAKTLGAQQEMALQLTDLHPQIKGNQILDNRRGTAILCEAISPFITSNIIRSKSAPPIQLFSSDAVVRNNKFTTSGIPAVQIVDNMGAPVIEDNVMVGVRRFPVLGESKQAIVRNNRIESEFSPGFGVTDWLTQPGGKPTNPASPTPGAPSRPGTSP